MVSFKAKFPVLQELFAKNHRGGALWAPPAGRGLMLSRLFWWRLSAVRGRGEKEITGKGGIGSQWNGVDVDVDQ